MPTYEYACSACGHEWDQIQRITEAPVELCPKCEKSAAHRLISRGTNFILKGGGWYSDLYSSSKPAAKAPESASSETPAKVETKTDGKAESKSETKTATPAASTPAASSTPASTSSTSS